LTAEGEPDAAAKKAGVEIEYCTQCRWLPRAAWLAQELLTSFEGNLAQVTLVPGSDGSSWSGWTGGGVGSAGPRLPRTRCVKRLVRDRVAPGKDLGHTEQ